MIQEEHIRFVASADVTDDCRVQVRIRQGKTTLTASQARKLAAELNGAADEAENAIDELLGRRIEPAAVDLIESAYCSSQGGGGFLCTRPGGHVGVHAAQTDLMSAPFAAWSAA